MKDNKGLPLHIAALFDGFDGALTEAEFNNPRFAYRVLFVRKTANRKGQADRVMDFVKADSPIAKQVNAQYVLVKETERPKHLPGQVVAMMHAKGFAWFEMHHHTKLWKNTDAKNPGKGYGTEVAGRWFWYDSWIGVVEKHCADHKGREQ